ncbi:voltage-gated potassium channel [Pseudarcicella hirudinis]|uniref:Voltage-gated potassium channel n=1 Tax=Pseudarcicella hirudinis TaxID=1079859 RepID=A0A1I5YFE2_9BACT|nr:ion transporter [Pseudarcicella hirudinis]SFQ42926.1 voltage-gated potassium channel [Pseudarcicella hirudinis]
MTLRKKVYSILEVTREKKKGLAWFFDIFLLTIISLNTVAIILHTVKSIRQETDVFFVGFETFSVIFFSIEYLLRVWVCVENPKFQNPVWGRLRYMVSFTAIIDFLAIFPFYVSHFTTGSGLIRILRLFRIFRLFKFTRYIHALRVFENVFREKREELILSFVLMLFMLIISSSIMFYVEHDAQPKVFSSIPATLWWGVSTITTVGYGDTFPITPLGKFFAGVIAVSGVVMIALPTGILTSGFSEHISSRRKETHPHKFCPHCGKEIEKHT